MPKGEKPSTGDKEKEKLSLTGFEFGDSISAEEYLEWKGAVPPEFRRLVESSLKNAESSPSQTGLPLTDQFLNKFAEAIRAKDILDMAGGDKRGGNLFKNPPPGLNKKAAFSFFFKVP